MLLGELAIGVERWWHNGFALRSFVGYAQGLLTASPYSTIDFPYLGTGMGYAFAAPSSSPCSVASGRLGPGH